jgi:hypothetical protein
MTSKIKSTSKRMPAIVSTSKRYPSISKAEFAKALGAERVKDVDAVVGGSPPAIFALRQALYQRLRSTGGRPSLEGAGERKKIPLLEGDWEKLEEVAKAAKTNGVQPTPAQVASMILHRALQELRQDDVSSPGKKR